MKEKPKHFNKISSPTLHTPEKPLIQLKSNENNDFISTILSIGYCLLFSEENQEKVCDFIDQHGYSIDWQKIIKESKLEFDSIIEYKRQYTAMIILETLDQMISEYSDCNNESITVTFNNSILTNSKYVKMVFQFKSLSDYEQIFKNWIVMIKNSETGKFTLGLILDKYINKEYAVSYYYLVIYLLNSNYNKLQQLTIKPFYYLAQSIRMMDTLDELKNRSSFYKVIISPRFNTCVSICNELSGNDDFNEYQRRAINAGYGILQFPYETNKILLIHGPPGTGKTHTLTRLIKNIFANLGSLRILICCPSNNAIDEIGIRLVRELKETNIKLVRIGKKEQVNVLLHKYCLDTLVEKVEKKFQKVSKHEIMSEANIILSTLSSSHSSAMQIFRKISSKYAIRCLIVDEASQCVEPELLMPLIYPSISKVILIGDPKQLPATVISQKASKFHYERSLFERFFNYFQKNDNPIIQLKTQYRMHKEICSFPSKYFYNSELKTEINSGQNPLIVIKPYFVFDLLDSKEANTIHSTKMNNLEAGFIYKLLKQIFNVLAIDLNSNVLPVSVGIITFYRGQVDIILKLIESENKSLLGNIDIGTVDSFQGKEKDIIILSTVRASNFGSIGFTRSQNRLNVALTRAKSLLCVCIHSKTFNKNVHWKALLKDAEERKRMFKVTTSISNGKLVCYLILLFQTTKFFKFFLGTNLKKLKITTSNNSKNFN